MFLNRFCIDEDAAFELSVIGYGKYWDGRKFKLKGKQKGEEYSFLRLENLKLLDYFR